MWNSVPSKEALNELRNSENIAKIREYKRLRTECTSLRGYKIVYHLNAVRMSYRLLEINEEELLEIIEALTNRDSIITASFRMTDVESIELLRCLQNYLASVKSLVELVRRRTNSILEKKSMEIYKQRISHDFLSPEIKLIEDLRNLMLHGEHPPLLRKIYFSPRICYSIELDQNALRDAYDLSAPSRLFLESIPDGSNIMLKALVSWYRWKIKDFYRWLDEFVSDEYKSELDLYKEKKFEFEEYCRNNGFMKV